MLKIRNVAINKAVKLLKSSIKINVIKIKTTKLKIL